MDPTAEPIDLPQGYGTATKVMEWTAEVPPPELADRLVAASKAKYGYGPPEGAYAAGVWVLRPERARAWSAFPTDVARFRFPTA